jgi:ADP-ribose pyrophosphatase YjhB (NUDIX family)
MADHIIQKVYAYITRGDQLLVFRHVGYPEAGIQVPGGTLEEGESPQQGVMREAREETGLADLRLEVAMGIHQYDVSQNNDPATHLRHFYHLTCGGEVPGRWQHYEMHPSDGSAEPILFDFYWVPIVEAAGILHPYYITRLDALQARGLG